MIDVVAIWMSAFKEILYFTVPPTPASSYFKAKQYSSYTDFQGWIKRILVYVSCSSYSSLPSNSTLVTVMQTVKKSCLFFTPNFPIAFEVAAYFSGHTLLLGKSLRQGWFSVSWTLVISEFQPKHELGREFLFCER